MIFERQKSTADYGPASCTIPSVRRKAFAARVWSKLMRQERAERLFSAGDRVLAAVSGGPDSVCLAHYLAQLARRKRFWLALLYVDHGLRKAAAKEAVFVRALAGRLGLPFSLRRAVISAKARRDDGLEAAARRVRYAALAAAAKKLRCGKVATGHQLDDQAETVLLNLLRGTQLAGLGGMPASRALSPGVTLVRPLLALSRADVQAYLEVHGLKSRLDRSNLSTLMTRNWLRR